MSKEKTTMDYLNETEDEREVEQLGLAAAKEGFKAIHAYLTCQSQNTPMDRWLKDKAKAGGIGVTGYTRLYASKTNRRAVEVAGVKIGLIDKPEGRKRLKA